MDQIVIYSLLPRQIFIIPNFLLDHLGLLFKKKQNLNKISSKLYFLLQIIFSALDNIHKLGIVLILYSRIAHIANNLGFSSIYMWGAG